MSIVDFLCAMSKLSDAQREAFVDLTLCREKPAVVAARLGCSKSCATSHAYLAKQRLQKLLGGVPA